MSVRYPTVAGQFYPDDPHELTQSIEECFLHKLGPRKKPPSLEDVGIIYGLLSPHAGYIYSGPVAAHGYYACSSLKNIELAVVIGPNHWGIGSGVATVREGVWSTPLGEVEVDSEAAKKLVNVSGLIDFDETAHMGEHSLEVQLPFLIYIYGKGFKLLPISMAIQDKTTAVEVGQALSEVVKDRRTLLIASSDLTHYEPHERASQKDHQLLDAILKMDVNRHYTILERMNVTACGYGPIAAVVTAAKMLGAKEGKLLKYATSGDVTGDFRSVVGYASAIFI